MVLDSLGDSLWDPSWTVKFGSLQVLRKGREQCPQGSKKWAPRDLLPYCGRSKNKKKRKRKGGEGRGDEGREGERRGEKGRKDKEGS